MRNSNELISKPDSEAGDDTSLFSGIYQTHYRKVIDAAYHVCRCKTTSEEIVQEVFIKLWINKDHISEIRDLDAYLFMLARNLSIDHLRRQKLKNAVFKEYSFLHANDFYGEECTTREVQRIMNEAVEQLHPQQKRVYTLKKFYGWRRDRIARQLNISENTVKATMQKALHSVKKYLRERVSLVEL